MEGYEPIKDRVDFADMPELDQYVLIKLQRVIQTALKSYDQYQFHSVFSAVHNFCTIDLSQFYLDVSKDRLYTEGPSSIARRSAQTVMYDVLVGLLKLIAPIIPHTADEVLEACSRCAGG